MFPEHFEEPLHDHRIPNVRDLELIQTQQPRPLTHFRRRLEQRIEHLLFKILMIQAMDVQHELIKVDSVLVLNRRVLVKQIHHEGFATTYFKIKAYPGLHKDKFRQSP